MKRLLKYLLCTAAGVVLCSRAAAIQPDEFLIQHFEPASPSFDITITAIFQDSRGLMWFGTNGGLFRYDGYDLSPVAYPSARPGFKRVRSICEDKNGDIWFGTNGGLFRYHHITARTEVFRPKDPGFSIVSKVISLSCGKIAFTARNYGAWLLDPSTGEYSRIAIPGTQEDETLAMCQGDAGMLYFLSAEKGLFRLDPGRSTTATPLFIPKKNPFEGIVLYNIEYYDYRIIAGMAERTYIIDLRNENIEERDWSVVNAVCKRVGGGFFAATNRGLLEVDANLHVIRRWTEDFSDNYALHDKSIKALCVDREGNLWAGTSYAGLYFLAKNHSGMRRYYPSDSMPASAMRIKEIVEDENGIMWLGSENGGLLRFDPSSGRTTRIPLPIGTSNILGLCVDGPWLWIGSYSRKDPTLRLDRRTLQARPMPNLPNCVYYICKAEDGQLFLTDDHALFRDDSETDLLNGEEAVSPAGFQYVSSPRKKRRPLDGRHRSHHLPLPKRKDNAPVGPGLRR